MQPAYLRRLVPRQSSRTSRSDMTTLAAEEPRPEIVIIRCSADIAKFLGAVPTRKSKDGLDLINPDHELLIWTRCGGLLAWNLL